MKKKNILWLVFLWAMCTPIFAQENFRRIGIGIGYYSSSIVGDSVHPFELSVRYRINSKHTVQLYTPLWIRREKGLLRGPKENFVKQEHHDMYNETWTHSLWGIGVGYDYTFYSYSGFNVFTGCNLDFQKYEYRYDLKHMLYQLLHPVYDREPVFEDHVVAEINFFYWDRVKGANFIPHIGIRFLTPRLSIEGKLSLCMSWLHKKAYSYGYEKWPASTSTWQSYYPDKYRSEIGIRPNLSVHLFYYF